MISPTHLIWRACGEPEPPKGSVEPMQGACVICGVAHQLGVRARTAISRTESDWSIFRNNSGSHVCAPCAWASAGKGASTLRFWSVLYRAGGGLVDCDTARAKRAKLGHLTPALDTGRVALLNRGATQAVIDLLRDPPDGEWVCSITTSGKIHHVRYAEVNRGRRWMVRFERWREASGYDGWMWGLRAEESRGRLLNWRHRGAVYQAMDGTWRSQPLVGWCGRDLYAYCFARDIELPALYQACRFHADDPSRLRKAMWLPGAFAADGEVIWLRTYYPSLYATLQDLFPAASRWA